MENLMMQQKLSLAQLTKLRVNYKKDSAARKTVTYYEKIRIRLQNSYDAFNDNHRKILSLLKGDENELTLEYFSSDVYSQFDEMQLNFASEVEEQLKEAISKQQAAEQQTASARTEDKGALEQQLSPPMISKGKPQGDKTSLETEAQEVESRFDDIKLPRISIPKFDGDYNFWVSFRDLFKSLIHNRVNLSKVQKLHYLKSSLTGEAESLLRQYAVTEANYDIAWRILNDRYDNVNILLNNQFKRLFSLPNAKESASSLKILLDQTMECVQAIENMGIENQWHAMLVHLISQRLPSSTRQLWEQEHVQNATLPSLSQLSEFVQRRFRALEASGVEQSRVPRTTSTFRSHNLQNYSSQLTPMCVLCQAGHHIRQCPTFVNMAYDAKFELVKRNRLCINCLAQGHMLINCPSRSRCVTCRKSHHTLLHRQTATPTAIISSPLNAGAAEFASTRTSSPNSSQFEANVQTLSAVASKQVLLATALVRVESSKGCCILRALLDQGSQASFVSENAMKRLNLKRKHTNATISGIGKSNSTQAKGIVWLTLKLGDGQLLDFEAYILDQLTNSLPTWSVTSNVRDHLKGFELADPHFDKPGKIDILLGADVYAQVISGDMRKLSIGPILQKTSLGWIVSGALRTPLQHDLRSYKVEIINHDDLNNQLRKFWELEEIDVMRTVTKEEQFCEEFYLKTTERDINGRFVTRLPFREDASRHSLGASRNIAIVSLLSLERKFAKNPELYNEYSKCIQEYLNLNHMHISNNAIDVQLNENGTAECKANYLPHHVIYKESSSTRARVVFDASRKTSSGMSLNDTLYAGPSLQGSLDQLVLKWRCLQFVFVADIQKMYRQIRMHPEDADLQRIVWRNNPNDPIQDYTLDTVTFGVTCAPFLAIRTLRRLAEDHQSSHNMAHQAIFNEFYVDDLLSGGASINHALAKRDELRNLLSSAGFNLKKWAANDEQLLNNIPMEDRETLPTLDMNLEPGLKTLGIIWHPTSDEFAYKININMTDVAYTKRKILSDIAKLFDPLGWISPVIIIAKIMMQSLWLDGIAWDERVPVDISTSWHDFKSELQTLCNLRIPRWLKNGPNDIIEIHGFSDASQNAYAAVVYIISRGQNKFNSSLLVAKTKVAPVKAISIPRLELCGALLLAKTIQRIMNSLKLNVKHTYLWTDSTIVLSWLAKHPSHWTTFVANRTTHIHEAVKDIPWSYIPSEHNPADVASRGTSPKHLIDSKLWWSGPSFLEKLKEEWPANPTLPACTTEQRKKSLISLLVSDSEPSFLDLWLSRYSSLTRLIRITAYCFRFIASAKGNRSTQSYLSTSELNAALQFWLKYTQQMDYREEIENLKQGKPIDQKSSLLKLDPFLDENGILRVGGRLQNADLPYDTKYPILISKKNRLVPLIFLKYHTLTLHGGAQLMLNTIRQKFWIINARNLARQFIQKCIICYKMKAQSRIQLMGNLPEPRVTPSRPFSHCGIDYCGPIDLKVAKGRGSKTSKGYIAIFVCLSVKAIHLELVGDLSTQSFLAAFRRFVSRRGLCSDVYSDCGTNFVGANKELIQILKRNRNMSQELANDGITWHFNPPSSPHFGGLWEAGVKSTKHHLKRITGNAALTYEEFNTVLIKVEACLNSRPLCPLTNDPKDLNALTPGHFLVGNTLLAIPEDNLMDLRLNRLSRWQFTQRLTQDFWKRWSLEYITRLQERPKWNRRQPNIEINDLVLIKDERLPSYKWPMGRITKTHPGTDGLVRVVTVRTSNKELDRPITKIALLPIEKLQDNEQHSNELLKTIN